MRNLQAISKRLPPLGGKKRASDISMRDAFTSLIQDGKKLVYISIGVWQSLRNSELDKYFRDYLLGASSPVLRNQILDCIETCLVDLQGFLYVSNLCNLRYVQKISYSNGGLRISGWLQGFTQLR